MFTRCGLLFALAINFQRVKGTVVESVNGLFAPWGFVGRAPTKGVGLRLVNNHDLAYLVTVLMGTPEQQIPMAVSLSQNLLLLAPLPGGVHEKTFYNPAISLSYIPSNTTADISTISGGSTTGRFADETCTIQSTTSGQTFTYNASVAFTDPIVTSDLFPPGARAILGYGVNAPDGSPPGSSLLPLFLPERFTNAVCGIELNHYDDPFPDGMLTMGAIDEAAFSGDFTNVIVPETSNISWSIPVDMITLLLNGSNKRVVGSLASVDMYHTSIQVTNDVAHQIYAGTPGAQAISDTLWSIPCNSTFQITLTFAGKPFTIYERDTILKGPYGTCTGVITGGATGIGKVGAPFLRNVYTRFSLSQSPPGVVHFSVGFATKVPRQVGTLTAPSGLKTTYKPNPSSSSTSSSSGSGVQTIYSLLTLGLMAISIAVATFLW